MRESLLVFGAPKIDEDEVAEVVATLRSGWIGTGPRVAAFEAAFAEYKNVKLTAAVNSCTAALHLCIRAAGIGEGDEVITTPMTFCATVNAIIHAGAVPVLADVDSRTMNLDPVEVERKITQKTRAILPVHFAGRPCNMDALCDIAARHQLLLIEDCAHAIEAEYHGRKTGMFGDFGCFSFYVTKNVTTGEGGMVITKREDDLAKIKVLALHGMSKDAWKRFGDAGYRHYHVVDCGFKYNMMDIQAALGIHQLQKVERYWLRRRQIWELYMEAFRDLPIELPADFEPETRHACHLFTLLVDKERAGIARDHFLDEMTKRNIGVGVHYVSIPEHPYYRDAFGWNPLDYPNALAIGRSTVSLPISAALSDNDVADVIDAVLDILT